MCFWYLSRYVYCMNNKVYPNSRVSDVQIDHASKWAVAFTKTFNNELKTNGVPFKTIYEEYKKSTPFPMGVKSFAPMLHLCGLESIHKANVVTYVIWNSNL